MEINKPEDKTSEEVKDMEARVEVKKNEAAQRGEVAPSEKELLEEALKEKIAEMRAKISEKTGVSYLNSKTGIKMQSEQEIQDEQFENKVQELVSIALAKSIEEAVKKAQDSKSEYLLDALHDALADEYYHKLVAKKKIKEE